MSRTDFVFCGMLALALLGFTWQALASPPPVFRTTCPYCDAKDVQSPIRITITGCIAVNGEIRQQRIGEFKCHCKSKKFTQPLPDVIKPVQPVAEEVVLKPVKETNAMPVVISGGEVKGRFIPDETTNSIVPLPPMPPYPTPVNPRK